MNTLKLTDLFWLKLDYMELDHICCQHDDVMLHAANADMYYGFEGKVFFCRGDVKRGQNDCAN